MEVLKKISMPKALTGLIFLHVSIVLLSLTSLIAKQASLYQFLSPKFWTLYIVELFIFGMYALIWQQVLKRYEISIAYLNTGLSIIWVLLWAHIFFNETININNIIGSILVIAGIALVSKDVI